MDLGFLVFSVFVMMISPLGDVRCSAGDAIDCPCPAIPPVDLTQPPPETCFKIDSRFRYSCTEGYVRKAGTSNLIKCQNTDTGGVAKWTVPTLQCIPDPNIIQMPPPSPAVKQVHTDIPPDSTIATTVTATTGLQMTQSISTSASVTAETDCTEPTSSGLQGLSVHTQDGNDCPCPGIPPVNLTQPLPETCFQIDSRFRYNCTKGYVRKAGTSNLIKCQNTNGVAEWTEATLQCIPDPKIIPTPQPSPIVTQVHTDIPPDSTIATTVTAATTVLQMTQSISTSASVTAETDSTEPTSSGLQVLSVHTQAGTVVVTETKTTAGMTPASTTAVPSLWSTVEPQRHELTSTAAKISIGTLVIICACAGLSFYYYKRRTKNMIPVRTSEEDVPMSCSQPATAAESSRMNGDQDCGV
ncbi:interleukin-15 receptor subunit alpha isoform X2 [Sparus aurata]|uniref:interleukin-15 receptor subunit alpha isoform X2 n=1 Tax=Sparus aurata TaxID=8175 RepID=UPI0011C1A190|nr:interleukin-15 receptor subunit alpha isoform X2 [Sparus aurata]